MSRRVLKVWPINTYTVEMAGYGCADLHRDVCGRMPVYAPRSKRWLTSPRRMRDVIALAEERGYVVVVFGDDEIGGAA